MAENEGDLMTTDAWKALISEISAECRGSGTWTGEARRLRDAFGATRITAAVAARLAEALADAGYELDQPVKFESDTAIITPTGTKELAATVEALLPTIRELDAQIPALPWKDGLVATYAVGRWLARKRS